MPLAFQSLSHGEISFGFFNIETDLILLNRYFFFAADFCEDISRMAAQDQGRLEASWSVYILEEKDIGNLMGAIGDIDLRGFIGDVYKLFPFPPEQSAFKQNPEGYKTRDIIEKTVLRYSAPSRIPITGAATGATISIGDYVFAGDWFGELLKYVWVGGYPRWKDGVRPSYVVAMKDTVEKSTHPLFGITRRIRVY